MDDRGIEPPGARWAPRVETLRWLGVPVAALAVLAVLNAVQGQDPTATADRVAAPSVATPAGGGTPAALPAEARLVDEQTFQLALPAGWRAVPAPRGATFAAVAPGSEADAALWVERDPELDFAAFEARSLAQLESLAGSARVVERSAGPSPEASSVRIAPVAPDDSAPAYEVLLRSAGDRWYYLATTVQPGAGGAARSGADLVQGSLVPQGGSG